VNSPEVFYLNSNGEQRGPYTIHHIDHLLNSGLIPEESMFWREGMEQWEPVTNLVARRKKKERRWIPPVALIIAAVIILIFLRIFGPITWEGWREMAQTEFTSEAAYWRARDFVRTSAASNGVFQFHAFESSTISLRPPNAATAVIKGKVIQSGGGNREAAWKVELRYNALRKEWTNESVKEVPPSE
jgi:hypothetical protein